MIAALFLRMILCFYRVDTDEEKTDIMEILFQKMSLLGCTYNGKSDKRGVVY